MYPPTIWIYLGRVQSPCVCVNYWFLVIEGWTLGGVVSQGLIGVVTGGVVSQGLIGVVTGGVVNQGLIGVVTGAWLVRG